MATIKKESGENRQFSTGAEKQHSEGKGTPILFPGDAYIEVCKHFEDGAKHYKARNWEQGIPLSELINSMERHIADEKMGDTSERHDRAIAWNAIVYLAIKMRIQRGILPKELDDMPRYPQIIVADALSPLSVEAELQAKHYTIRQSDGYWYISDEVALKYLHKDLKLHKHTDNGDDSSKDIALADWPGYYATEELAKATLQVYLNKGRSK